MTAGESHGPALTAVLEGMPAGIAIAEDAIAAELARRQKGYGRGGRMKIEKDRAEITSGVRHGLTLGSPIALCIRNRDWENWEQEMQVGEPDAGWASLRTVRIPRPGHADLPGALKYGHRDMRNILERASARETAARVAVGAACRCLLDGLGVRVASMVRRIGPAESAAVPVWDEETISQIERSDVSCPDADAAQAMREAIDAARENGDSLGGVFEVRAFGLPPGLGSHVSADRRLDARVAGLLMSVPAIKGVEFGLGFAAAGLPGSQVHDQIDRASGDWRVARTSNNAGGVEGGMTNGEPLVVKCAMKPIPTLTRPLGSVDMDTDAPTAAHAERSDVCAVPAAAVVGEAAVCFVLADAMLEKFGGDNIDDVQAAMEAYRKRTAAVWGSADV